MSLTKQDQAAERYWVNEGDLAKSQDDLVPRDFPCGQVVLARDHERALRDAERRVWLEAEEKLGDLLSGYADGVPACVAMRFCREQLERQASRPEGEDKA
jgi:hypothetical protein